MILIIGIVLLAVALVGIAAFGMDIVRFLLPLSIVINSLGIFLLRHRSR